MKLCVCHTEFTSSIVIDDQFKWCDEIIYLFLSTLEPISIHYERSTQYLCHVQPIASHTLFQYRPYFPLPLKQKNEQKNLVYEETIVNITSSEGIEWKLKLIATFHKERDDIDSKFK